MAWKIDKGILGAFLMLLGIVALVGALFFNQYIFAIVLGTLFQTVQTSGINVTTETLVFLNSTQTGYFNVMGLVNNGAVFAGGLIIVAVVLIVFGAVLSMGRKGGKGKSKDDDMGY